MPNDGIANETSLRRLPPTSLPGPQEIRSSREGDTSDGVSFAVLKNDQAALSDNESPEMSSADRYVASRLGGRSSVFPETFPARGTYVHNALELIDGATVRPGTRLPVRKNKTTQTIGIKESYCPSCQVVIATGWAKYHLNSRQHIFTIALEQGTALPSGGAL
jgi:hypothetical protein